MKSKSEDEAGPPSIRRTLFGKGEWVTGRESRAHAMKNCLTVINGVAMLLEPELSVTGRSRLRRLEAASARLAGLVEEQLAFQESFAQGEEPSEVAVAVLVEAVRALLCDRAETAGVTFAIECEGALVFGVAGQLEEALFNVVSNALEATPRGGTVAIETTVDEAGDHVWVVRDTGGGMPREILEGAGDRRRSRREGGTGLGIAIAASIVRAHGGLLNIEAFEAHGTVVTIWLPSAHRDSFLRELGPDGG